jgi:hypothetical protein
VIHSGSHVLYGTLTLRAPFSTAVDVFLASRPVSSAFETRDRSWWLERIAHVEGDRATLFEDTRSSYSRVELTAAFVDALAAISSAGDVELHHHDNGVHVTEWKVRNAVVTRSSKTQKSARRITVPDQVRAIFNRKSGEIAARYDALGPADQLHELITVTRKAPGLGIAGGTLEQRRKLAEAIHRAHRPGTLMADYTGASIDGVFIPDVAALSPSEQGTLLELVREADQSHVYLGRPADLTSAIIEGRFREDLYYRISGWPSWTLDAANDLDALLARLGHISASG